MTSHALATNQTFPFVTMPHFALHGSVLRVQAESHALHYMPVVHDVDREAWERYALEHRQQIDDAYVMDARQRQAQAIALGYNNNNNDNHPNEGKGEGEGEDLSKDNDYRQMQQAKQEPSQTGSKSINTFCYMVCNLEHRYFSHTFRFWRIAHVC